MTRLPAAPAMTKLAGAIHPDAPTEVAVNVVARLLVASAVADAPGMDRRGTTGVLEAGPNAKVSVAVRC
jgi:hypothetical protein